MSQKLSIILSILFLGFFIQSVSIQDIFASNDIGGFAFEIDESAEPTDTKAKDEKDLSTARDKIMKQLTLISSGVFGIASLSIVCYLLFASGKLGASGTNSQNRAAALHGLLYAGIGLALIGGVGTLFGLFMTMF